MCQLSIWGNIERASTVKGIEERFESLFLRWISYQKVSKARETLVLRAFLHFSGSTEFKRIQGKRGKFGVPELLPSLVHRMV